MVDFADELLGPKKKRKKVDFADDLLSPMSTKRTSERYRKEIEEKTRTIGAGASFSALREASTVHDPRVRTEIFAKHRGIPVDRYRVLEGAMGRRLGREGAIQYQDEKGEWQYEEPTVGSLRQMAAGVAGGAPEEIATLIGGVTMGMKGAAGAAFLSSQARNLYNKLRYNERQDVTTYTLKPAIDTIAGATGALTAKLGTTTVRMGQRAGKGPVGKLMAPDVRDRMLATPEQAAKTAAALRGEGITPTLTEATGSRMLRGVESYQRGTASGPAGYLYEAHDRVRGRQVKKAIERKLSDVSPVESPFEAGEQVSSTMRGMEKRIRSMITKEKPGDKDTVINKLYKKAFKEAGNTSIDTKPVLAKIDELLVGAVGTTKTALTRMRRDLLVDTGDPNKKALKSSMAELDQYYKQSVNNIYRRLKKKGDAAHRDVGKVRRVLIDEIEKVSRTYKVARHATARLHDVMDRFKDSTVGKIVYRNEGKPHKIAEELLGPNTGVKVVKSAKGMLPEEDIQAIVRSAFTSRWNAVAKTAHPADVGDKLAKAVTREPYFMDKVKELVPDKQYKALKVFFEDVLPKTARVAGTEVAKPEGLMGMKERLAGVTAKAALALNLTPYGLNRNLQDFAVGKHSEQIARQILSGKGADKILKLRQVSDDTEKLIIGVMSMIGVGTLGTSQRATGARLTPSPETR